MDKIVRAQSISGLALYSRFHVENQDKEESLGGQNLTTKVSGTLDGRPVDNIARYGCAA